MNEIKQTYQVTAGQSIGSTNVLSPPARLIVPKGGTAVLSVMTNQYGGEDALVGKTLFQDTEYWGGWVTITVQSGTVVVYQSNVS